MSQTAIEHPAWLTASYMETNLAKALQDSDLKVSSIEVLHGSSEGDGFISQILRVLVHFSSPAERVSLIAKLKPVSNLSESLTELDIWGVESSFFISILPDFKIVERNISRTFLPKVYFVDEENKVIFMEDLNASGFVMQPRTKFFTLEQAVLGVEAVAAFHGASLLLLQKNPELKNKYSYCHWMGELPRPYVLLNRNGVLSIEKHLTSYNLPEKYSQKLLDIQKDIDAGKLKVCAPKEHELKVLNHGDLYKNNFMCHFKNGIADEVRLIDFQYIHYNGFAHDLHDFFFLNVSSAILMSELEFLLQKYYNKLKEIVPNTANLTLERIKKEFADRYFYGYLMAVLYRPFLTAIVPLNMDKVMNEDGVQDNGFNDDSYIADIKVFMPFFEKVGVL